ncbi:MAG: RNA polymerase sigma factor [Cyanobacteria bacterium P01_F01_bin.116]
MQSETVPVSKSDVHERFNTAMKELSSGNSQDCIATWKFIYKKVHQFHLNCDAYAVVNEAYLRGVKAIENGEDIRKPLPWVRSTAFNIIREWSRKQNRITTDSSFLENYLSNTTIDTELLTDIDTEVGYMLRAALSTLPTQERELLTLRWIDGLSWREIATALSHDGKQVKEGTVRKRGGRALHRLRDKYKAMEQGLTQP